MKLECSKEKLKVGDKVYDVSNMKLAFNPYHYKRALPKMCMEVVSGVSDCGNFYRIANDSYTKSVFRFESGTSHSSWQKLVKTVKDLEKSYEKQRNIFLKELEEKDAKEIAKLEKQLQDIKNKETIDWRNYSIIDTKIKQELEKLVIANE